MKAIEFPEQNSELSNGNPDYYTVPNYTCENATGDVIMKIQMTEEEWLKVKENGFCFWYTRQTGGRGLQPFSFEVETPFVKTYAIQDLSASGLESFLQPGSGIGNYHVSKDVTLFEVINITKAGISMKRFAGGKRPYATSIYTFQQFSDLLTASEFSSDFFIINPKENGGIV